MDEDELDRLCEEENKIRRENFQEELVDFDEFFFNEDTGNLRKSEDGDINSVKTVDKVKKRLLENESDEPQMLKAKRKKILLPMIETDTTHITEDPDIAILKRISDLKLQNKSELDANNRLNVESKKDWKFYKKIPDGDFQSITSPDGVRLYLNIQNDLSFETSVRKATKIKEKVNLLGKPYGDLRQLAEKELESINEEIIKWKEGSKNIKTSCNDQELWVDKYKPRSYLDLLSDECTNRTVLRWIKLWEKLVFGIATKKRIPKKEDKNFKAKFFSKFAPEIIEDFDEIGRPKQKIVLMCGAPGLGKTTLAHIIGAHAGYNVVEMNASDDRSADAFHRNLENALTMKSVFGLDKKPNCLIIDEIDGAPAASINLLVNLLESKEPKTDPTKAKKKKDKLKILRPIICICNDLYTPSLRPLRQMALVVQFPPTHSSRLAQRLLEISHEERLKADMSVLLALCNKTENDIRSCLSVLQFVRVNSHEVRLMDIHDLSVGQKDYQRSLFNVWNDIFMIPRLKRSFDPHNRFSIPQDNGQINPNNRPNSFRSRFFSMLTLVESCGEFEKLMLGWFENYLSVKFKHTRLEPVISGLEWATFVDVVQKEIYHTQSWSLNRYIPLAFVAFHFLFSSHSKPTLQYPVKLQEHNLQLTKNQLVLEIMSAGMPAYANFFSNKKVLVNEILPFLTIIYQPNLRPVNVQLFSVREKAELKHVVDVMLDYNLNYQQERNHDGTYSFTLDPNVSEITDFSGIAKSKQTSYPVKQLIAREVELEKVRRSEHYFQMQQNSLDLKLEKKKFPFPNKNSETTLMEIDLNSTQSNQKEIKNQSKNQIKSSTPNHLQTLQPKTAQISTTKLVAKDFFGRVISKPKGPSPEEESHKSEIWYKFKEGYSNAVRRPFKVKSFFL